MEIFFHRGLQQCGVGYLGRMVRDAGEVSIACLLKVILAFIGVAIQAQLERLGVIGSPLVGEADFVNYLYGVFAELIVRYKRLINDAVSFELEGVVVDFHDVSPSRVAPEGAGWFRSCNRKKRKASLSGQNIDLRGPILLGCFSYA